MLVQRIKHAYLEGYLTGLYLFNGAMFSDIALKHMPIFCYYNSIYNEKFITEKEFAKSLKLTKANSKKRQKAKKFIEKINIDGTAVYHHIPRI